MQTQVTKDRLNRQALTITEAEGLIRLYVKEAIFKREPWQEVDKRVKELINGTVKSLNIPSLQRAAYVSLVNFYNKEKERAKRLIFGGQILLFLAFSKLLSNKHINRYENDEYSKFITVGKARDVIENTPYIPPEDKYEILNYGNALNIWHERYTREYLKPVLDQMAKDEALDPDSEEYLGRRFTLRNRAEREVRHQGHIDEIASFKKDGVRLVIASSHANCSERCRPWQGRVYSLDNTYGTTPDGRNYVPLENATNILTPNGKWFNGLLGFNCRHYLVPYNDGYEFPKVSSRTEEREYKIDQKQRYLERKVREWRIKAEMYKDVDRKAYFDASDRAKSWYRKYTTFSHKNGRAYFTSRIDII